MLWLLPVSLAIGIWGARIAWAERRRSRTGRLGQDWWLLFILVWFPSFCWVLSQFTAQE